MKGSTSGLYSYNVGKFLNPKLILLHQVCQWFLDWMGNK